MAELARFYGIVVAIFFRGEVGRHNTPHVHVTYNEFTAAIGFDGQVLAGDLPGRARNLVRQWMRAHREELQLAWGRAQRGSRPQKIEPLP